MITIQQGNLFELDERYFLAHCISQDLKMGKGIAVEFKSKFQLGEKFRKVRSVEIGQAILLDRVFNLITKRKFWEKPSYETLQNALNDMKQQCFANNIQYLGLPKLGCGLDGLDWNKVKKMIERTFDGTNIDVQIRVM
jgi:O-acetyl-ADP-ribose deacetylase (regulator of RNase III)